MDESSNINEDNVPSEEEESSEVEESASGEEVDDKGDNEVNEESGGSSDSGEDDNEFDENVSSAESSSGNETTGRCSICLQRFIDQEVGVPEECDHRFCLVCIKEWAKTAQTCPIDRKPFHAVLVTRDNESIIRVEELQRNAYSSPLPEDVTHCEVCGLGDREDRLLLCDECDFAYHLECLDPPLETVPLDDWFCPACISRQNPDAIRRPPIINLLPLPISDPAAVSNTLLTRRIRQRRQKSRKTVRKRKSSSRRKPKSTSVAKSKSKPRKTIAKRRTKTKTSVRRKKGRRTKRRVKRKRPRLAIEEKPTTSRGRIAHHLGIVPPKPGQVYVGMPVCRSTLTTSTSQAANSSINYQRFRAGIAPLRLYSTHEDLADCIENESDDEESGSLAVMRPQAPRIGLHPGRKAMLFKAGGLTNSVQVSGPNILSEIMNSQKILHQDRNIRIGKDGVLFPSLRPNSEQDINQNSHDVLPVNGRPTGFEENSNARSPRNGILQAPRGNSESSANFSQFRKASCTDNGQTTQAARSDDVSLSSSSYRSSNSGINLNSPNHKPSFLEPEFEPLNLTPKRNTAKDKGSNKAKDSSKDNEDEEDFNIYSDIEEDPGEISEEDHMETHQIDQLDKVQDSDNDIDMIIDEGNATAGKWDERSARNSSESYELKIDQSAVDTRNTIPSPNIESDDSTSHGMPEADSPESIPLPDSTPPPSVPMPDPEFEEINDEIDFPEFAKIDKMLGSVLYSPSDDEESRRQEYDPSQPLTSSDEEEQSNKQKVNQSSNVLITPAARKADEHLTSQKINKLDLSSIPVPPEEHRRPAIQFSIPTRHKLIPISSLIKRQKGIVRKESSIGSASNYQTEISKAFGRDDETEGGREENDVEDGTGHAEKVSLVAEIFGSDEEEQEEITQNVEEPKPIAQSSNATSIPEQSQESFADKPDPLQSNKWKKLEIEAIPEPEPPSTVTMPDAVCDSSKIIPVSEANDMTTSISHSTSEDSSAKEKRTQARSIGTRKAQSSLELISDESDDEVTIISPPKPNKTQENNSNPDIIVLSPDKPNKNAKKDRDRINGKDKIPSSIDKNVKQKDKHSSRSRKGRRSSSRSNYEEGEIISPDKKKKKGKKNKKVKKRKRSKESHSSPRINFDERQLPDQGYGINSSSEAEEGGQKVSWRKPSKSTKERNYRDGKPKTEERYFREKEKARSSSRERNREKSPHKSKEKTRRSSKSRSRKTHRRSTSRHRSLSRSRSTSRNRLKDRKARNRSSSPRRSFSPRQPPSRSPRGRRNVQQSNYPSRKDRSRSGSPARYMSQSPVPEERHRIRKHSSRGEGRSGRAHSSSASRSGSRSRNKKRQEKSDHGDKSKKPKKDKEKPVKDAQIDTADNAGKDKEKRKKKRKKEKSLSPAKAVFADGDSIVISLNFQKPKEALTKEPIDTVDENHRNDEESSERKKKRSSGRDSTGSSKSSKVKPLKKTILIDLETSPVQEQKIGDSPALVVLTDDEDEFRSKSYKGTDQCDKEPDGVSTTGALDDSLSSPTTPVVQADSTQVHQNDSQHIILKSSDSQESGAAKLVASPARGDSLVTSTRDSIEGNLPNDEEMESSPNSPKLPEQPPLRIVNLNSPAVASSPLLPTPIISKADSVKSTPTSISHSSSMITSFSALSGPPNPTQSLTRPLGIGSIPGLFPSSASTGGIPIPPAPIVIPAPPTPQLRFPPSSMNPSINILASVANALYGPLMAARSAQPLISKPNTISSQRPTSQTNILLPKNQNSHSRRLGDAGGDSPFSPNSSEGDDLFEPPEKRFKDTQQGTNASSMAQKTDKNLAINAGSSASMAPPPKPKSKLELFDTLFGSPSKKPTASSTATSHHSKSHVKSIKSKSHSSKIKKVVTKKDAQKLTEGELRQTEDVPTSAVELRVKEKFLKKLNRQERVVEEVKLALKPHYGKKSINKDEYKEILRKAVPKVCHNKSGEINPNKIKELVEAYVKKFKHARRKQ